MTRTKISARKCAPNWVIEPHIYVYCGRVIVSGSRMFDRHRFDIQIHFKWDICVNFSVPINAPIANVMWNDIIMSLIRIRSNLHREGPTLRKALQYKWLCCPYRSSSTLDSLSFHSFDPLTIMHFLSIIHGSKRLFAVRFSKMLFLWFSFSIPSNTFWMAWRLRA